MKKTLTVALVMAFFLQSASAQDPAQTIQQGRFKPTDESFKTYQYPEWFRDAKFGIWAHWGPQAVPRQGDWYAKKMYISGSFNPKTQTFSAKPDADYTDHLNRYGHPSVAGYKDIIPMWKAERWDPDQLMKLYKRVGAKYFVSMGTHHDNFFLWNSQIHRWNSVNMGPKKDVVGLWQAAAKREGLRFGISEHLAASFTWFQSAHNADSVGDLKGVPYDGNDPKYFDLYHEKAAPDDRGWLTNNPAWQKEWFSCIKEVIDLYKPDLLYSDSQLPFGEIGRDMLAHYYNQDITKNNGSLEAVYTCKEPSQGRFVQDVERGVKDSISEYPWQTDTSIGDWFYRTGQKYKTSDEVVQMLVDIVSKNGNLLINVVQTPEGDLEPDVQNILEGIATWMGDNSEGIYSTRPWKIYGEGPSTTSTQAKGQFGGLRDVRPYSPQDIRFTQKKGVLYAFCMKTPTEDIQIKSLGKLSKISGQKVATVSMLGSNLKLKWKQEDGALVIKKPNALPAYQVVVFSIKFKGVR